MDTFDDFLTQKLKNDKTGIDIDNSSFKHLHYIVNLNATKSSVKRNSMFSFISDFLSPRFIIAKVAIVSILLVLFIENKENRQHDSFIYHADSTVTHKNSFDSISGYSSPISDTLYR